MSAFRWVLSLLLCCASLQILAMPQQKQIVRDGPDLGLPFSPAVRAGGLVYVSGTLATNQKGTLVPGDVTAQTHQVLDNISAVLEAAGSSLDHAAALTVYLKRASDFAPMNEVYRTYWKTDPPARTTVIADLVLPDALIEIAGVAVPDGAERKVIHPADWMASPNPYSYGIKSGDTLFLAGLVSRNGKDNSVVSGDITGQTKTVLENGGAILKAAGMTYGDVVSSRVYITDPAAFQDMNTAYRSYFPQDPPARATVTTGLTGPQYLVEITMVAVHGPKHEAVTTPNADGTPGRPNPNLSSAIQVGNRLYLSGMLGNTDANKSDARAQTREALTRIGRTLKAAGFAWNDVVDGVVYLGDLKDFGQMNEAYRESFSRDFPARATVRAPLVNPDGSVELMMTAVK